MGTKGIRSAYETGRGSIILQAKTSIEMGDAGKSMIVITELPYQVNKENLVKSIAGIAKERKFDGITEVQDYSDKRGMRIEIVLRRDVNANKALNYLLKHTNLRVTFGAIMLGLVDLAPRTCPVLVMLDEYLRHRRQVIVRRTRHELYRALEEVHLNEGFQIARTTEAGGRLQGSPSPGPEPDGHPQRSGPAHPGAHGRNRGLARQVRRRAAHSHPAA
ncbi:MAG: hypothetical protein HY248_01755 [Fimbriimonas ginsengisoli]|nr:hypothetical protein [Fimbriimonas ginsengisoli]